ncbi:cyanophycinase [Kamptonema animale CS-326]|jgi:cyanophycinase|uniref:cyanophycinase n=1 Tax=Kamptonema animale TaxID=92934 RepID=UPI002330299C|nr:cyanophycinase [Kamptonema animale]MDB9510140.1 cyanophycinase [Kamptonema animale CS-326]
MQQLTSQALEHTPQRTTTTIMVIGGAEDKVHGREILQTFFHRAGATSARLAIIPSASRDPEAISARYRTIFDEMGAEAVKVLDIREREQGEDPLWKDYLEDCTGVFMTGGDQLRLCGLLSDTPLMEKIRTTAQAGKIVLAGTSAGAAVMGHHMIAGGGSGASPNRSLVDMANGLDIIPEVIVDQHFHNRNRMARLLSAIASHPDRIGIGIDEDTCALFEGEGIISIMGKGTVTIVDTREIFHTNEPVVEATEPLSLFNLRLHILCHGDCYNMRSGKAVQSETCPNTSWPPECRNSN